MSDFKLNPPVFPGSRLEVFPPFKEGMPATHAEVQYAGLTLWDFYAGLTLHALLTRESVNAGTMTGNVDRDAADIADRMLARWQERWGKR